jgi:hypothetical protein
MIERHDPGSERQLTLGADKGYDTRGFVAACRELRVTPHVAAKVKHSAIDGRTTRHAAYATSQRKRKLIEEAFGWAKTIAGVAKVKVRGLARVRHCFTLAMTAYNSSACPSCSDGAPRDAGGPGAAATRPMASPIEPITWCPATPARSPVFQQSANPAAPPKSGAFACRRADALIAGEALAR